MQLKHLLLVITVMVIWGVNFSAIKLGVSQFDPLLIAAGRFFCATFPIIFFIRRPSVQLKYLLAYGVTFGTGVWGMLFAPIPLVLLSISLHGVSGIVETYEQWNSQAWFSVLFQAYPTTVFGYWVWNKMILQYPMAMLAPMTLLTSVFALVTGYIIFDEYLTPVQWISCALFLAGIIIVLMPTYTLTRWLKNNVLSSDA